MKKLASIVLSALLIASLAACGGGASSSAAPAASTPVAGQTANTEEPQTESGTVTIQHGLGETEVALNPERIVVMDFGVLDIFEAVGIEVGALPQGTMPTYLEGFLSSEYVNAGSLKEMDYEAVNEYGPDLILISGRLTEAYDECSAIAPTVYVQTPGAAYIEQLTDNVRILSEIFPAKAAALDAGLTGIISASNNLKSEAEASGLNALVLLANDGSFSVYGAGSRYGIIHEDFGFGEADGNIDASTHGQESSFEYIAEVNPDVIFVVDRSAAIGTEGASGAATLLDTPLVNGTTAAQEGRIVYLSSDVWYLSNGGFTGTLQMIAEAQSALAL